MRLVHKHCPPVRALPVPLTESGQTQPGTFKETSAGVYGGTRRLQGAGKPLVIRGGIAIMRVSAVNSELHHSNSLQG